MIVRDYDEPQKDEVPGVDEFIRYENGEMDEGEALDFMQRIVTSGLVYQLQGSYGRAAHAMGLL